MDAVKNTVYDLEWWRNIQKKFVDEPKCFVLCDIQNFAHHWGMWSFSESVRDYACTFLEENAKWKEQFTVVTTAHYLFVDLRPVPRELMFRPDVRQIRIEFLEWLIKRLEQ